MNHWVIFPILIPAVVAPLIVLTSRRDEVLARVFSVAATLFMLVVSCWLWHASSQGHVVRYELGQWPSPFGIVFVLDRLSATMLVLSGVLGFVVSLAAIDGWDQRGRNFHALLLLQLGGINGAFLTGDLFNLFVYFEVMLIASYGLMVHGGGADRLRAGIQFVVINLCGSSLFLVALGLIYGTCGGLQMSDVGQKIGLLPEGNRALMSCGITLLMMVFAVKAALVPLHFWLPSAYGHAPPLIAALFAIATKVGIYCMIRVHGQVISGNEGVLSQWTTNWLQPAGLVTIVVGMVGVLASRTLCQMGSYATLASSGTIVSCVALLNSDSLAAGLYYLAHSTLAGAVLFLIADAIACRRGADADQLVTSGPMSQRALLGGLFLIAALAITGMPPLSGFIGKLLILDAMRQSDWGGWMWVIILATSLLGILGFARAGSTLFWKCTANSNIPPTSHEHNYTIMTLVAGGSLMLGLIALTAAAGVTLAELESVAVQVWSMR
ncbi:MAG: monovalent cation/H+ antiporter subunit D [Pirellulaceae bacterium]|nr:monovalent cation/H+ antiporter subunit D [Pirellulaceae bacterium]